MIRFQNNSILRRIGKAKDRAYLGLFLRPLLNFHMHYSFLNTLCTVNGKLYLSHLGKKGNEYLSHPTKPL